MNKLWAVLILLVVSLVAAGATACEVPAGTPTATPSPVATLALTSTPASAPAPTPTAAPTASPTTAVTLGPTSTPTLAPTPTSPPTATPKPTSSATPTPTPAAPFLEVEEPKDGSEVSTSAILVSGRTIPGAVVSVFVNDDIAIADVDQEGRFSVTVALEEGPNIIEVVASDQAGREECAALVVIRVR